MRFAVDAYVTFARTHPWLEAVAASLSEQLAPDLATKRLDAFARHYPWIGPRGHAYFQARAHTAPEEGAYAMELVLTCARTPDEQRRAIAAVAFTCDVLWGMLDAIQRG